MSFTWRDLNPESRRLIVEEIDAAIRDSTLYFSKRFNPAGTAAWPALLREAAGSHDEHWLAYQLEARVLMSGLEGGHTPSGGYTIKHVPQTAAEALAEGQFNRYYILGLSRRAMAENRAELTVYRAKPVKEPRSASVALVGKRLRAADLIEQLRPVQSSLTHELLKPNSGLSVHL